jgi:predicted transposase/invertase (TIGR01784 family)
MATSKRPPSAGPSAAPSSEAILDEETLLIHSPHDRLFRKTLSNSADAAGLIRAVLPPSVVVQLDLDELHAEPESYVDEQLKLSQSDVLYRTRYRDKEAFVYVLFEHKSSADRWVVLQLIRYLVKIWERQREQHPEQETLSVVLPMIVYHGEHAWTAAAQLSRHL